MSSAFVLLCAAILYFDFGCVFVVNCSAIDGNSDLLILGHSFVRRLQEYVFRRNDTNKVVGADLGNFDQLSNVFYRGIGGLTLLSCLVLLLANTPMESNGQGWCECYLVTGRFNS